MDQETARLLITASAGLLGGVVGAIVTSVVAYKNNSKMLRNSTEQTDRQWTETRAVEREKWLRDEKRQAYVTFFEAFRAAITYFADRDPSFFLTDAKAVSLTMAVRPTVIKLIAPDPIRERAEEVYQRTMWLCAIMTTNSKREANVESSWDKAETFIKELEDLCRDDLKRA